MFLLARRRSLQEADRLSSGLYAVRQMPACDPLRSFGPLHSDRAALNSRQLLAVHYSHFRKGDLLRLRHRIHRDGDTANEVILLNSHSP